MSASSESITSLDVHEPQPIPASAARRVLREQSDFGPGRWGLWGAGWGNPLWWGEMGMYGPGEPVHPFRVPFGTTLDRRGGRDLPLVWTELDLRGFRVIARYLCDTNPFAIGFINRLIDYHIRKGFGWQACLAGARKTPYATLEVDTPENRLVARAQSILDQWRDTNNWPARSREAFRRWRRDGEVFGRFYSGGWERLPVFRFVEPEQIGSPTGDSDTAKSFGIHTDPDDIEDVWEYYVRSMTEPGQGRWECAASFIHIKANVDANIKRGITDFLPIAEFLDDTRRLIRSFLSTAADMANIAGWERFPFATMQQVQAIMPAAPNSVAQTYEYARLTGPVGPWGAYRFRPGTVVRTEASREWEPGPTADGVPNFVQAAQAALRGCGARWGMPEYFSGDASNNNFASSLVAGSPFAVAVEGEQLAWGSGWERRVALKVLDYATDAGYFTPAQRRQLDVEVTEPAVVTPRPVEDTQQRQILNAAGILSPQTWQLKEQLDPRHEAENWRAWRNARLEDGEAPDAQGAGSLAPRPSGGGGDLKGTVGGLQAIRDMQTAFYAGEIPREAAVAAMRILFGFRPAEAAALFPDIPPEDLTEPEPGGRPPPDSSRRGEAGTHHGEAKPALRSPAQESAPGPPPRPGLVWNDHTH